MTTMTKAMALEIADNWAQMAETEVDSTPARREALRECADLVRMIAERDTGPDQALIERDTLLTAAGFKCRSSAVATAARDIAGLRPAAIEARRREKDAADDAILWRMLIADAPWRFGSVGLLAKIWKQRRAVETDNRRMRTALEWIERWGPFPETGRTWENADGSISDRPMSYGAAYGWIGERTYVQTMATIALANPTQEGE